MLRVGRPLLRPISCRSTRRPSSFPSLLLQALDLVLIGKYPSRQEHSIRYVWLQFDKNGNTGGCQATYTVISSSDAEPPTCQNVTFPLGTLDVDAAVANGPLSQYGWVDQVIFDVKPEQRRPHSN
ncbi:hypothetical protein DXG03_004462 [Asterophora parasitica]|uniref:Uncharacterized protein n=1 Tax=Asterophora parasitica TaxID=117018 RepID=A0A9P7GAM3_9AGAR|nr:hypothetical protein DXG03_004462 [Asterophora parasitica]